MGIRTAIFILLSIVCIYLLYELTTRYVEHKKQILQDQEQIIQSETVTDEPPDYETANWNFRYMTEEPTFPEEQPTEEQPAVEEPTIVQTMLPPIRRLVRRFGVLHRRMRRPVRREHLPLTEQQIQAGLQFNNMVDGIFRIQVIPEQIPQINRQNPEQFFQNLEQHQNDGQNVHDSNIRKDLTRKLLRVIELDKQHVTAEELGVTDDQYNIDKMTQTTYEVKRRAAEYFNGLILREADQTKSAEIRVECDLKLKKIDIVLDKIKHGFTLVMANGKIYREDFIMNKVWDRVNSEDNQPNREQLQIALIDNLVDCVYKTDAQFDVAFAHIVQFITGEQYTTHCINGRVARVITSMILLDNDEIIAQPEKDMAEVSNEAYSKAHTVLNTELAKQTEQLQELFGEDKDDLNPDQQEEVRVLEEHLKKEIADVLTADYKDIVEEEKLAEIIRKAQAGV
jgi:hypothetical protein